MKHILFVCSGNTCRSPLAEGIARQVLGCGGGVEVGVSSAGTSALEGTTASEDAEETARRHGISLDGHRAQLLSGAHVRDADLIVTMGERHRQTVGAIDPAALEYTRLITSFSETESGDVPDPIGGGLETYERTYQLIRRCIEKMAESLADFDGWKPK